MSEYAIYPQEFKNLKISKMHNECFIIMSFDEKNTGVYEIIKKAAKACNIKCNRSDELTTSLPFFNKIATSILTSYYLIVDISDLRANVLYELGIAHTLRDAANVLIIKEKGTICPSDFSYINYFSYENKANMENKELYRHIINFFKSNNYLNKLKMVLMLLNIIPSDMNPSAVVEDVNEKFGEHCITILNILNNEVSDTAQEELNFTLDRMLYCVNVIPEENNNLFFFYTALLKHTISKLINVLDLKHFIESCINDNSVTPIIKAEIIITLINADYYSDLMFEWIQLYLRKSNPASLNIVRYKLQIALIDSRSRQIDDFILSTIKSGIDFDEQSAIMENLLNVCIEKKMKNALEYALQLIEKTSNPYQFRTAIDLVTEIGTLSDILEMLKIVKERQALVGQYSFINVHVEKAQKRMDEIQMD